MISGKSILIVAGMVLAFIFSLLFVFMRQELGLVSKDYYKDELKYEKTKEAMNNAKQLDLSATYNHSENKIRIIWPEKMSGSVIKGKLLVYFPSDQKLDKVVEFDSITENHLDVPIQNIHKVPMRVKLEFNNANKEYYKEINL